jgi:hypothetical protein
MKKSKQISPAPDWAAIFKKRPDLEPPGYRETCALIKSLKEANHVND